MSVEQLLEEAFAAAAPVIAVTVIASVAVVAAIVSSARRSGRRGSCFDGTALYDLVEFAAIEPHAPALWAIVGLDALPLAHDEIDLADRTGKPLL